ncbi:hypothetical protein E2562_016021 [Oryza meyeriana var. granulata]|uniref:Uncharacterized protein n=1 Tax=Oryza meyeriana var. granulata TaxID=110450 RepID=A0A6G1EKR0_9ORYZ|nr:hypothetical protein E2562_016021 [Oryza meyeriana var. granulata]
MSPNWIDYDSLGCLRAINGVAKRHNMLLRFATNDLLKACCGTGGAYNWNASAICAMPGVVACKNPSASVSWDGVHYTEAINNYIAKGWINGPYADLPILAAIRN